MAEEAKEKPLDPTNAMKQKQWMSVDNRTIFGQEYLYFGEEPVKNVDAKLDILKFSYSWATEVEDHERQIEEALQLQTKEGGTEKELQEGMPMEEANVKMPEKPQEVTSEDQTNDKTEEIQDPLPKEETQEKMDNDLRKSAVLFNDEKLDTGLKREVLQIGQELNKVQPLSEDEDENNDHFILRKLFLFGINEFKNDATQITTCTEIPVLNVLNPLNKLSTTCISERTMTTVSSKKSLRRRIKNFLGFK